MRSIPGILQKVIHYGLWEGAHYRPAAQIVPDQGDEQLGGHGVPVDFYVPHIAIGIQISPYNQ